MTRTARIVALWLLCVLSLPLCAQEEKRLSIYTPQTNYSLPVLDRDGADYVGLLEILEPMGAVSAHQDGRKWKLKFNDREAQFTLLRTRAKVHRRDLELSAPFLIENGRGLVPLRSLADVVPELLADSPMNFHESGRRLFIGGAEQRYTVDLAKPAAGRLLLSFAGPVNPFVATEPGKLRLVFSREPVVQKTDTLNFPDPLIPSVSYVERNGALEITVIGTVPLMATFSEDHKNITVSAMASSPRTSPAEVAGQTPPVPAVAAERKQNGNGQPERPHFFVMIDASHGGDDRGATISDKLAEKDVTLALARRLHRELESRGVAARLLRDSDTNIGLEQRANAANVSGAALFITLHAAGNGTGVRVYTSALTPSARPAAFLPWETAQSANVQTSGLMAASVVSELLKRDLPAMTLANTVRPLNNVAAPAVAIEVSPPMNRPLDDLNSAAYQQSICSAIAGAIVATRPKLPHGETAAGQR